MAQKHQSFEALTFVNSRGAEIQVTHPAQADAAISQGFSLKATEVEQTKAKRQPAKKAGKLKKLSAAFKKKTKKEGK